MGKTIDENRLREIFEEKRNGRSQVEMADMLGVTPASIHNFIHAKLGPGKAMLKFLNVHPVVHYEQPFNHTPPRSITFSTKTRIPMDGNGATKRTSAKHGTRNMYNYYRCRCPECRAENTRHHREWYQSKRQTIA